MVSFTRYTPENKKIEILVLEECKTHNCSGAELFFGIPVNTGADSYYFISDDSLDLETLMDYWIDRIHEFVSKRRLF